MLPKLLKLSASTVGEAVRSLDVRGTTGSGLDPYIPKAEHRSGLSDMMPAKEGKRRSQRPKRPEPTEVKVDGGGRPEAVLRCGGRLFDILAAGTRLKLAQRAWRSPLEGDANLQVVLSPSGG